MLEEGGEMRGTREEGGERWVTKVKVEDAMWCHGDQKGETEMSEQGS